MLASTSDVVPQTNQTAWKSRRGPLARANAERDFGRDMEEIGKQLSNTEFSFSGRAGFFLRNWTSVDGELTGYAPKSRLARELYRELAQLLDSAKKKGRDSYQIAQVTLGHQLGVQPRAIGAAVRELTLGPVPLLKVTVGRVGRVQKFQFVEHPWVWRQQQLQTAEQTRVERHERSVRAQSAVFKALPPPVVVPADAVTEDVRIAKNAARCLAQNAAFRAIAAKKNWRQPSPTPSAVGRGRPQGPFRPPETRSSGRTGTG